MRYCMDCEHYIPGGVCGKTGKVTGALKVMCGKEEIPAVRRAEEKTEKYCRKCGRTLPIDQFSRSGRSSDGRQTYCRECANKARKSWYDRHIKV